MKMKRKCWDIPSEAEVTADLRELIRDRESSEIAVAIDRLAEKIAEAINNAAEEIGEAVSLAIRDMKR